MHKNIEYNRFHELFAANRSARLGTVIAVLLILIQFFSFKHFYPFPNFLPDSYSYLEAAAVNNAVNMWPIGYSKFLRFVSCFTRSDDVLIFLQFGMLQVSQLYLVGTVAILLKVRRKLFTIMFFLSVLNPLLIHSANFISSDALFASLSLVWVGQLLWIIKKPTIPLIIWQAVFCAAAFSVRYNALYYPVISIIVIAVVHCQVRYKIAGVLASLLFSGFFVGLTSWKYYKEIRVAEFSPFSGWQMAANALYGFAHVDSLDRERPPQKFMAIQSMAAKHMDSLNHVKKRPDTKPGLYYLWDGKSPLKTYVRVYFKGDTSIPQFYKWALIAGFYRDYGGYLAKTYPFQFFRYYLLPNTVRYYVPDAEFLGVYNMGGDEMQEIAVKWFEYENNKVKTAFKTPEVKIMQHFPVVLAMINLLFVLCLLSFLFLDGWNNSIAIFRYALVLIMLLWTANLGFSVFASPIVLRYQIFPLVITLPFLVILLDYNLQLVISPKENEKEEGDVVISSNVQPVLQK
jgi:hypothetical protein